MPGPRSRCRSAASDGGALRAPTFARPIATSWRSPNTRSEAPKTSMTPSTRRWRRGRCGPPHHTTSGRPSGCELHEFWRFNAFFGDELLRNQPYNDGTAWNRLEYRPLEGFVFAVSPFNFTSIAGNLPTAPMLMGNTLVFKPATQTLLVSHFLMELLIEAGMPRGVINMVSGSAAEISDAVLNHRELAG